MIFDATLGFWAVLVGGVIMLTIQQLVLYNRLTSLVQEIEDFTALVISSYPSDKGGKVI